MQIHARYETLEVSLNFGKGRAVQSDGGIIS